jgi:carboxyl-terminal processing protease
MRILSERRARPHGRRRGVGSLPRPLAVSLGVILTLLVAGSVRGDDSTRAAVYEELRVFDEALTTVHDQYVEEISVTRLLDDAIVGTLLSLNGDNAFLGPATYRELQSGTAPKRPGVGLVVTRRSDVVTVVTAIDGSPAQRAGLRSGDRIVKIDGLGTEGLQLWQFDERLRGAAGTTVALSVWREGWAEPRDFNLTRAELPDQALRSLALADGVLYLRISRFGAETPRELEAALDKLGSAKPAGIVLDLRNDPGGNAFASAVATAGTFLGDGQLVAATDSRIAARRERFVAHASRAYRDAPMAVLVNGGTASAAEVVAGALQDWGRAVVVGTRTFGKGDQQSVFLLPDGSAVQLTTARYLTPNGHPIDGKGITPDIVVDGPEGAAPAADPREDVLIQRALEIVKAARIFRDYEAAGAPAGGH